jgi:DNA polymerase bacteriophage-type
LPRFQVRAVPTLFRDIETRSVVRLTEAGAWRYAADPTTEVLCAAYAVDDGPAQIWTPDQPIPEEFFAASRDPDWLVVAHHDAFETAIEERLLGPRYNWPPIPTERHRCTMAMALASALPGSLDGAAAALGLVLRKDTDGHRLMLQMAKPRRPRKGEDPDVIHWQDDLDRRLRLQEYCRRDVEIERELFRRLPPLSETEQALWLLDQAINRRGFHVDLDLAEATRAIVRQEQEALDAEITELTGGEIVSVNQVAKLAVWLQERGHQVTGLTKRSVAAVLSHEPALDVRRLLELRQQGAQAAARKLDSLIAGIDADQRLRGTLRYHGAATGRWSGTRFQPQNLKKAKDIDAAIEAIRAGDLDRVHRIGAPLAVAGDVSRAMIRAAPGHVLVGVDFSAVESRVLAWIAGETWKLDAYRQFDETGDPALEPYCVTASKILRRAVTPEDEAGRQIGKVCDLAFGYGGGLGAWRRFDTSGIYTDADIETFKTQWRNSHRATVRFWTALENGLKRALRTGKRVTLNNLAFEATVGTLYLTLPSGRRLAYPEARLERGKFEGTTQIVFKDNARGGWSEVRGWHGTFTENVVQAVARDLLAAAMLRLEAASYPVVLHVHDEAVCEVPEGSSSTEQFLALMTGLPDWASGLPIAAKAWTRTCYAKTASAPTPVVDSALAPKVNGHALPATGINGHTLAKISAPTSINIRLGDLIGQPLSNGKIVCPFHADKTPSLHIYDDHWHCFGCGARGDHVDWLMMVEGKNRAQAEHILKTWNGPAAPPRRRTDSERTLAFAHPIWKKARPIAGTPAIRYLADVRGIDIDALPAADAALRFHPRCPFGPGVRLPCLVALYRDVLTDVPAGIHRIALTEDVLFAGGKVQRRTLGSWSTPRAIKIWPATDHLFLGEGIETTLAAATRLEHCGAPMRPAWAAGSAGNIEKFPVLDGIALTLLVDHDAEGERAANACRYTWRAHKRDVARLRPDRLGADFNDIVLERDRP